MLQDFPFPVKGSLCQRRGSGAGRLDPPLARQGKGTGEVPRRLPWPRFALYVV